MKAYKATLLILDFEGMCRKDTRDLRYELGNIKGFNSTIMDLQEAEIGEWDDSHPLNRSDTQRAEFDRLFNPSPQVFVRKEDLVDGMVVYLNNKPILVTKEEEEEWYLETEEPWPFRSKALFREHLGAGLILKTSNGMPFFKAAK